MISLGVGTPQAVSYGGSIIVGYDDNFNAFIWDDAHGIEDLRQVLIDRYGLGGLSEGWQLSAATGISANGDVIVGRGVNPLGFAEGWIAAIPEPAGLGPLLMAALQLMRQRAVRSATLKSVVRRRLKAF